ncbi:hypothetical protein [Halomonas sp. SpR8]|uniref:hypothetical protein n=1 Tax=Halomonas sp. SpR8 TaxID=3050463 RepID=UPI0027E438FA|nr:hypothetical protein [Halomonas sp. SpR8]MDQ7730978.1 hypothetical protein [Halomonas sp. SpR8]
MSIYNKAPSDISARLRDEMLWLGKITTALLRITPLHVFTCTALYILSQISMLAAILLPWKLLMVMSTDGYPWMMPDLLRELPKRELIVVLGIASFLAFAIYVTCEILIGWVCRRGSTFILDKNQKIGLFSGHRQHAALLYRRFLRAVAAIFTIGVIFAFLAHLYPYMLLALTTYLIIGLTIVLWQKHTTTASTIFAALPPEMRATVWWGAGFFYAVAWLTANYWHGVLPSLATAFIALLLVRQAIVLIFPVYGTYAMFSKQKNKVSALFLPDVPWHPGAKTDDAFMALIAPLHREVWVNTLLRQHHDATDDVTVISCRTSSGGKATSLITHTNTKNEPRAFLIKLFHTSNEENALHERDILETLPADWLAPRLCGVHDVEGNSCHVFEWPLRAGWMSASKRAAALPAIRNRLLALELPDELISRYERSRSHLSDRLKGVTWDLLISISPKNTLEKCQQLQQHWPDICHEIHLQPRQIVIPRLHLHLIGHVDNKPLLCNWTRWLWEPIGAGWPLRTSEAEFQQALTDAAKQRPCLTQVNASNVHLTALLYQFERLWHIRNHTEAIKLVVPLYEAAQASKIIKNGTPTIFP